MACGDALSTPGGLPHSTSNSVRRGPDLHLTPDGFDHGVDPLGIDPSPGTVGHDRL
ncbi:MAG: hypothetical protein ACXVII_38165 [Solirubrobacteraceae bacterium]